MGDDRGDGQGMKYVKDAWNVEAASPHARLLQVCHHREEDNIHVTVLLVIPHQIQQQSASLEILKTLDVIQDPNPGVSMNESHGAVWEYTTRLKKTHHNTMNTVLTRNITFDTCLNEDYVAKAVDTIWMMKTNQHS